MCLKLNSSLEHLAKLLCLSECKSLTDIAFLGVKDSKHLILRAEQKNNNVITASRKNSLLKKYFGNRWGLPNGAFVRENNPLVYERTDVMFYTLDEEQFIVYFSA